ncbi:putative heme-binding protein 2-like isoform X1 [Penaeus vannamei]|uniref:Putative heme-binding protein 2-like isoform X1 n=1 Tax=Penaeus vannamei TaxID=6689 RepID=A0A3R7P1F1_PENVA|nr:putative heme-binding protein 2-like isoform X1 [Penaeus vannamei]
MTTPVTTLVIPGEGPSCGNNFTMSFYVPAAHQDNPPTPTNPDVYIEERPELHIFSRRFQGFVSDKDWIVTAVQLHDDLVAASEEGIEGIWFMKKYMN